MNRKYPKGSMADRWDKSTLILLPPPLCHSCKHYGRDELACVAFPDGIPSAILAGDFDHHAPYPGDSGVVFEEKQEAASPP